MQLTINIDMTEINHIYSEKRFGEGFPNILPMSWKIL